MALHEAGHAKDFAQRDDKGTYAALRLLPLVPLYQEARASNDALGFRRARRDTDGEMRDTPLLWGAWGSYLAGEGLRFYDGTGLLRFVTVPVAWVGNGLGRIYAFFVLSEPGDETAPVDPPQPMTTEDCPRE